ncbi:MAG: tetratricopeptide repeat protein [bacterium]|nr:tetratricopeptide repeat protein [bacterium]
MLRWLCAAALVVLVAVAFSPTLQNGFVDYDDNITVTENLAFRGLSPAHLRWMATATVGGHWQPLAWLTLAVDHAAWDMEPRGYHLTNLAWHALAAVLVMAVLAALLRAAEPPPVAAARVTLAATLAAAAWALHPLRVESVAWVTERRDLVSTLFWLAAVLAYLRAHAPGRRRGPWLAAAVAATALSLLGKAWAITLPAVLLIVDAWPLRRFGRERVGAILLEKLPFVVLALLAAAATRLAQAAMPTGLENHPLPSRLVQAAYGLVWYPWTTLVPTGLSPLHELVPPLDPAEPRFGAPIVLLLAAAALLVVQRRRWPALLAAVAAYVVIVSPVLGLAQVGPQLVADRYAHLATLPFFALAAGGLYAAFGTSPARAAAIGALAGVAILGLGAATWRQTQYWHDDVALWTRAVEVDGQNAFARTALGAALQAQDRLADALPQAEVVLALLMGRDTPEPVLETVRTNLTRGWATVAMQSLMAGDADDARTAALRALGVGQDDAPAMLTVGAVLLRTKNTAEAALAYERALAGDPTQTAARTGLAAVQLEAGEPAEAEKNLRAVLDADPSQVGARINLGVALRRQGRPAEAIPILEEALRLEPNSVAAQRGLAAAREAAKAASP